MSEPQLSEVPVADWELIERIGRLRVNAWESHVGRIEGQTCWLDAWDRIARHWAFVQAREPVAAARLSVHNSLDEVPESDVFTGLFREPPLAPIASLNRLVVDARFRGIGLSRALDRIRLAAAEKMGCRSVVLSTPSGEKRVRQLKSFGFVVVGQGHPYRDPGDPAVGLSPVVFICRLPMSLKGGVGAATA